MKALTVFFIAFLFFLPVSAIQAQTGTNPTLVGEINLGIGRANEVKAWGGDYIYGKTDNDFFSTLGLVSREGAPAWSYGFDWSYFNTNSITVASDSHFIFALMDTIYKVDRQGNIQRVKTPSTENNFCLYKGENGRYLLTIPKWNDPVFKFFIYDEDLNYHGEFVGASSGGARRIIEHGGHYYVATDQYGGGTYSNRSINFDKYDANGNLAWTTKIPDATRADLVLVGERLYFNLCPVRQSPPTRITRYGELSLETGDTLWTRQWIATSFPMGVESSAYPINSFASPDGGFVIVGEATSPGQTNPNVHAAFALLLNSEGEEISLIRSNQFSIFNAGDWNSNRELILSASGGSSGGSKLFFYSIPGITGLDDEEEGIMLSDFTLSQNYPNPFNPSTTIKYSLPKSAEISIKVFDILGKEVATLVNGYQEAGSHKIDFHASQLPSGVYIYRLQIGNFISSKKMMLMK